MCIGERIHIVARKVRREGIRASSGWCSAAPLSLSCLLSFFPFVHSLILLSCAYSPLTILSLSLFLTNRLFCQFLALSLSLSVSFPLLSRIYTYVCACVESSTSSPPLPSTPSSRPVVSGLLVSSRFVSFFVSEDKPTVRSRRSRRPTAYTRTRQLLRTTRHIVYASLPSRSFSPSLSLPRTVHTLSRSVPHRRSRFLSFLLGAAGFLRIRYLRRGAIRRQFPSSDKVCIAAAEHGC